MPDCLIVSRDMGHSLEFIAKAALTFLRIKCGHEVFQFASSDRLYTDIEGFELPKETDGRICLISGSQPECVRIKIEADGVTIDGKNLGRFAQEELKTVMEALQRGEKIEEVCHLGREERDLIASFQGENIHYDRQESIYDRFLRVSEDHAERPAISMENDSITYAQLVALVESKAFALDSLGLKQGDTVALYMEKGMDVVATMMACLKLGITYIPLSRQFPVERILVIMEDSGAKSILADCPRMPGLEGISWHRDLTGAGSVASKGSAEDRAYIIYTSGTTGKPKGVPIRQRCINNLIMAYEKLYGYTYEDRISQFASLSFDQSVLEIYSALLTGACLCLIPHSLLKNMTSFENYIHEQRISWLGLTPSVLAELRPDRLPLVKTVESGGEAASLENLLTWLPGRRVFNTYGPTEYTVNTTTYELSESDRDKTKLPIGRLMPNTLGRIRKDRDCGIGEKGELLISGEGLSDGYLNRPELTADRFIELDGRRWYRTGDLAAWQEDGNIEFFGRMDDQVKLRGLRIELSEIEAHLNSLACVQLAVVLVRQIQSSEQLVAYLTTDGPIRPEDIKADLSKKLPEYMVPSHIEFLDEMPRTINGKVDKKKLAARPLFAEESFVEPTREEEIVLAKAVCEVFNLDRVSMTANFFALGGDSLKAARLLNHLERSGGKTLAMTTIFQYPKLAELAEQLENESGSRLKEVRNQNVVAASPVQKRMMILHELDPASSAYHIKEVVAYDENLTIQKVHKALSELVRRHESLRTSFECRGDQYVQIIHQDAPVSVEECSCDKGSLAKEAEILMCPMELSEPGLLRVKLCHLPDEQSALIWDIHHIITDGISQDVLLREFKLLYDGEDLPEVPWQYRDYSAWLENQDSSADRAYWKSVFQTMPEPLDLTLDFPRPSEQTFNGDLVQSYLSKEVSHRLKEFSDANQSSPYMVLLATFACLLHHYSDQEDLVIGTPVTGRLHPDAEAIVGMFVNTLPLRIELNKQESFRNLIQRVRQLTLSALSHQGLAFEELLLECQVARDPSRNPLFDVMFNMLNMDNISNRQNEALGIEPLKSKAAQFDLSLDVEILSEGYRLNLEYATKLFRRESMEIFLEQYVDLLTKALAFPELPLVDQVPQVKQLAPLAGKRTGNIIDCFRQQCQERPDQVALTMADESYSYSQLLERSRSMAGQLQAAGVRPGDRVGLYLTRSPEMIIAILGILAAGAAYVPMDKRYPEERLAYIREDAEISVLVTDEELSQAGLTTLKVDPEAKYEYTPVAIEPDVIAYLIYTSGSTGRPKGVMVKHHNVLHLVEGYHELYEMASDDVVLQFASISFDQSVWEIFGSLLKGLTLCLLPEDLMVDPAGLVNYVGKMGVTVLGLTPALLREVDAKALSGLRLIESGGAAAQGDVLRRFLSQGIRVFNTYGPTEATVNATSYEMTGREVASRIPIGRSMPGSQALIIKEGRPVDRQIPGELCLVGENVAAGYHNREDLTQDRFVPSPLGEGRMYRTGDLARVNCLGEIEFLGRLDDQVKLRGFRIELGEIEALLSELPGVDQVAVVVQGGETGRLVAYLVAEADARADWQAELAKSLPPYMIPTDFVLMDRMPLNNSGKIDRKKLPAVAETKKSLQKPKTPAEEQVARCFAEALDQTEVGRDESFFDLGGHSIKAIRLISLLEQTFGRRLTLKDLYGLPRPWQLAELFEAGDSSDQAASVILPAPVLEYYPQTSAQKRIFLLEMTQDMGLAYHLHSAYRLKTPVASEKIQEAINELARRHQSLRSRFRMAGDQAVQEVLPEVQIPLEEYRAKTADGSDVWTRFIRKFDLATGPLARFALVETVAGQLIFLDCHHIISDGVSNDVLFQELDQLLLNRDLPEQKLDFIDYSHWLHDQGKQSGLDLDYWTSLLQEPGPLNLITDGPRPGRQTFTGKTLVKSLPVDLSEKIERFASAGRTEFHTLMAAFSVTLSRFANQNKFHMGTVTSGRDHHLTESMVGMFVNTIALPFEVDEGQTFSAYVTTVSERLVEALDHAGTPFDEVVTALVKERDFSRNPLFDVMFTMERPHQNGEILEALAMDDLDETAAFDLTLVAVKEESHIRLLLEYNTSLFQEDFMKTILNQYIDDLQVFLNQPEEKMVDLPLCRQPNQAVLKGETRPLPEATVAHIFLDKAGENKHEMALISQEGSLTYGDLEKEARAMAAGLKQRGIGRGNIVAVDMKKSRKHLVAILGIMLAGAAWVSVDSETASIRTEGILQDCQPALILTEDNYSEYQKGDFLEPELPQPEDLAYLIYTSGSTGKPKGVMVNHASLINLYGHIKGVYDPQPGEGILHFAAMTFDASIVEMMTAFLFGASLYLVSKAETLEVERIQELLKSKIDIANFPPNYLPSLDPASLTNCRVLITGGSAMERDLLQKYRPQGGYSNEYGPTENTVVATYWPFDGKEMPYHIPIGQPVNNVDCLVLKGDRVCAVGMPGELCLAGKSLAVGYLGRPDLTEQAFTTLAESNRRIYRTGDIVRVNSKGLLEFLGRQDHQVKLRGFRIELAEIESVLRSCPGVSDAVVKLQADREPWIAAWYIGDCRCDQLLDFLDGRLPDYMIPSGIMAVDSIPVNSSGKVDRKSLPEICKEVGDMTPVEGDREEIVAQIFAEILKADRVGKESDFYRLGGDSIKAIRVAARFKQAGYQIEVRDILDYRTVERIAAFLEEVKEEKVEFTPFVGLLADSPMIHNFRNEWLMPAPHHFNLAMSLEIPSRLSDDRLAGIMDQLTYRHDCLRAKLTEEGLKFCSPEEGPFYKLRTSLDESDYLQEAEALQASLNPASDLIALLRIKGKEQDRLLMIIHHIIVDVVSLSILHEDFMDLMEGRPLPDPTTGYADWHEAMSRFSLSGEAEELRNTWALRSWPKTKNFQRKLAEVKDYNVLLSPEDVKRLMGDANEAYNTKAGELLFAAFVWAIRQTQGDDHIGVLAESHGRQGILDQVDLSRTVGWFTSVYPVLVSGKDLETVIIQAKEGLRCSPVEQVAWQWLQPSEMTQSLNYLFNFFGQMDDADMPLGTEVSPLNQLGAPVTFTGAITEKGLEISITVAPGFWSEIEAETFMTAMTQAVGEVLNHCLTQEERVKTSSDFDLELDQEDLAALLALTE